MPGLYVAQPPLTLHLRAGKRVKPPKTRIFLHPRPSSLLRAIVSCSKSPVTCCAEEFECASHVLLSLPFEGGLQDLHNDRPCIVRVTVGRVENLHSRLPPDNRQRLLLLLLPCLAWTVSMATHPQDSKYVLPKRKLGLLGLWIMMRVCFLSISPTQQTEIIPWLQLNRLFFIKQLCHRDFTCL